MTAADTARLDQAEAEIENLQRGHLLLANGLQQVLTDFDMATTLQGMTLQQWLEVGFTRRWIIKEFCAEHDPAPMTRTERQLGEAGHDLCLPALRLWRDAIDTIDDDDDGGMR